MSDDLKNISGSRLSKSSSGGRPLHEGWLGYQKVYQNDRLNAKCLNCFAILANTAKSRLQKHR